MVKWSSIMGRNPSFTSWCHSDLYYVGPDPVVHSLSLPIYITVLLGYFIKHRHHISEEQVTYKCAVCNCIFKSYGCSNIFQLAKKNNIAYIQNMNLNILLFESNLASTLGLYVSNESLGPLNSPYIGPIFCLIYLFLIWNGSIFHSWLAHVMIDRLKLSHIWKIYGIVCHT